MEITDASSLSSATPTSDTPPQPVQKLLKDVLENYMKAQMELCESIIELFKRHDLLQEEVSSVIKRKRGEA